MSCEYNEAVTRGKKRNNDAQMKYYRKQKQAGLVMFHCWVSATEKKAIGILLQKMRSKKQDS